MRILICDDHALFREGLRHVLVELGEAPEILEAAGADEALALAAPHCRGGEKIARLASFETWIGGGPFFLFLRASAPSGAIRQSTRAKTARSRTGVALARVRIRDRMAGSSVWQDPTYGRCGGSNIGRPG